MLIFSQSSLNLRVWLTIVFSSLLLHIIVAEDWPVIVDPFPDDVGTEPPPTEPPPTECSPACVEKIDAAVGRIALVEQQLATTNTSLYMKLNNLEASYNALQAQILGVEASCLNNVTGLTNKIDSDVAILRTQISTDITKLKNEVDAKLAALPSGSSGGSAAEVYMNLTSRITNLETGKIQTLINDNSLWRQNFRVVNSTFAKLKKSNGNNNVVLKG